MHFIQYQMTCSTMIQIPLKGGANYWLSDLVRWHCCLLQSSLVQFSRVCIHVFLLSKLGRGGNLYGIYMVQPLVCFWWASKNGRMVQNRMAKVHKHNHHLRAESHYSMAALYWTGGNRLSCVCEWSCAASSGASGWRSFHTACSYTAAPRCVCAGGPSGCFAAWTSSRIARNRTASHPCVSGGGCWGGTNTGSFCRTPCTRRSAFSCGFGGAAWTGAGGQMSSRTENRHSSVPCQTEICVLGNPLEWT